VPSVETAPSVEAAPSIDTAPSLPAPSVSVPPAKEETPPPLKDENKQSLDSLLDPMFNAWGKMEAMFSGSGSAGRNDGPYGYEGGDNEFKIDAGEKDDEKKKTAYNGPYLPYRYPAFYPDSPYRSGYIPGGLAAPSPENVYARLMAALNGVTI
jgi:hypothetical protein